SPSSASEVGPDQEGAGTMTRSASRAQGSRPAGRAAESDRQIGSELLGKPGRIQASGSDLAPQRAGRTERVRGTLSLRLSLLALALLQGGPALAQIDDFRPVTQAMLE